MSAGCQFRLCETIVLGQVRLNSSVELGWVMRLLRMLGWCKLDSVRESTLKLTHTKQTSLLKFELQRAPVCSVILVLETNEILFNGHTVQQIYSSTDRKKYADKLFNKHTVQQTYCSTDIMFNGFIEIHLTLVNFYSTFDRMNIEQC